MTFDIAQAIEVLGKAVEKGLSFAEEAKERQSETEVIKENKRLRKAVNYAERLILHMHTNFYCNNATTPAEVRKYKRLLEVFLRYN